MGAGVNIIDFSSKLETTMTIPKVIPRSLCLRLRRLKNSKKAFESIKGRVFVQNTCRIGMLDCHSDALKLNIILSSLGNFLGLKNCRFIAIMTKQVDTFLNHVSWVLKYIIQCFIYNIGIRGTNISILRSAIFHVELGQSTW